MDLTLSYAYSIVALFAFFSLWRLYLLIHSNTRTRILSKFRHWIWNFQPTKRLEGSSSTNISIFISIAICFATNAVVCSLHVSSLSQFGDRCAVVAITNLVPLFIGGGTNIMFDKLFKTDLRITGTIHRWLGRLCIVEVLIHAISRWTKTAPKIGEILVC